MMDLLLEAWVSSSIEAAKLSWMMGKGKPWRPGEKLKLLFAGYNGTRNMGSDVRVEEMLRQIRHVLGSEKTAFTVTADALIRLKADGIAEPVIATMLNPEAPFAIASTIDSATTTKASSIDPGDPLAPRDAGIYINVKTEGRTQFVALEQTVFSQGRSGGWLGSALTYGIKKTNRKAVVRSARASNDCGIVRPSAVAVLRFTTNSNLVGCSIGSSAGLAPFRILSTKVAARRYRSAKSAE